MKHDVKKRNIAAVHMQYRNTIPPLRRTILGSVSPWSGPPCQTGHLPRCDCKVNNCPMNISNKALRLPDPCPPLLVASQPLLLIHPCFLLQDQEGILSGKGAIWGDEEHHLHQWHHLVMWHVRERLTDAPASCLCSHRQEMAGQPWHHSHLGGHRCCSLQRSGHRCHHWLRWWWSRGAQPLQLQRAALALLG